jgi:hypothetical protein
MNDMERINRDFALVKACDAGMRSADAARVFGLSTGQARQIWMRHLVDPTLLPAQYQGRRLDEVNRATAEDMRLAYEDASMVREEANRLAWRVDQARRSHSREAPQNWPGPWPLPAGEPAQPN